MRDLEAGSRSRPFMRLSSRALGVKAPAVYGTRRCGRRAAHWRVWRSLSVCLLSLSSEAHYASKLPGSSLPVLTQSPFLGVLDCAKRGGDADGTRF
jgi:hypothetical protein